MRQVALISCGHFISHVIVKALRTFDSKQSVRARDLSNISARFRVEDQNEAKGNSDNLCSFYITQSIRFSMKLRDGVGYQWTVFRSDTLLA